VLPKEFDTRLKVGGERIWRLTDFENLSPLHMLSFSWSKLALVWIDQRMKKTRKNKTGEYMAHSKLQELMEMISESRRIHQK